MRHFDLCVIGTGSANSILDRRFADQRVVLVEAGTFGGTCLNVGCIPTKMLVYPADLAASPGQAERLGIDLALRGVRWRDIRDRIFGRIDSISHSGEQHRATAPNVTLIRERVRFVAERTLETSSGERFSADRIVIGAGSRPTVPDIEGLSEVDFHTSDTVMRIEELPASCVILGGGYVACEFAHIFSALGVAVTILNRSGTLLSREDGEISAAFTTILSGRVDVRLNTATARVESLSEGRIRLHTVTGPDQTGSDRAGAVDTELLLVATGRTPNGDTLDLDVGGVKSDERGFVVVDEFQRTSADGVWAMGDASSHDQLKHVANQDAEVVQHNLLYPEDLRPSNHRFIPHAVFSDPQIASVGLTEDQAREQGAAFVTGSFRYGDTAYGWAMEDDEHFVKLLADPSSGLLLGAHLMGPQASIMIQPLIQAMVFGTPAREVVERQYWIHPSLIEVVENALLALPLD